LSIAVRQNNSDWALVDMHYRISEVNSEDVMRPDGIDYRAHAKDLRDHHRSVADGVICRSGVYVCR
jgi:hypothetical protein